MTGGETLLRRKVQRGGVARSPLSDTELLAESFARELEDRLRPILKAGVAARVARCGVEKLGEATGGIAVPAMLGILALEGTEAAALLGIDGALAYHLHDLTLGGDARAVPTPHPRRLTAVDMAVGRMHLDALVAAVNTAFATALGRPLAVPLALIEQRQNLAQVRLGPDYADVLMLRLTLALGEAGRAGDVALILPLATIDHIRAGLRHGAVRDEQERRDDLWRSAMRRAAAGAPVVLDAVLHRVRMTVAAAGELKVGQVIDVPAHAPHEVELTLAQPAARPATIAIARLGAFQDMKVVKLLTPLEPAVAAHVAAALREPAPSAPAAAPARIGWHAGAEDDGPEAGPETGEPAVPEDEEESRGG